VTEKYASWPKYYTPRVKKWLSGYYAYQCEPEASDAVDFACKLEMELIARSEKKKGKKPLKDSP
jgi:hypothetical protein